MQLAQHQHESISRMSRDQGLICDHRHQPIGGVHQYADTTALASRTDEVTAHHFSCLIIIDVIEGFAAYSVLKIAFLCLTGGRKYPRFRFPS